MSAMMNKREPRIPAPAISAELALRLLQEATEASDSDPAILLAQAGRPFQCLPDLLVVLPAELLLLRFSSTTMYESGISIKTRYVPLKFCG